ncbi:MAG: serpin family protein [Gemmatimonadales bacterium]
MTIANLPRRAPGRDPITVGVRPHQSRGPGAFLLLLSALAGCSGPTAPDGPPPLLEALPRSLTASETATIAASNQFAFDLLNRIVTTNPAENAFVSPLSVSLALGMVMDGARGQTRDDMAATLGFGTLPQADINDGYRTLIDLLQTLDDQVEFRIANSVWTRQGFPVKQTFLDDAAHYFDAKAASLDFASPAALNTINGWVSEKTNGKIPKILSSIESDEILFAVNAIYFKGLWRDQFKKSETASATFHATTGDQSVPFMHRVTEGTPYYQTADFEAVDLWYGNSAHTMTIVLPKPTTTATDLARQFTASGFAAVAAGLHPAEVEPGCRASPSSTAGASWTTSRRSGWGSRSPIWRT